MLEWNAELGWPRDPRFDFTADTDSRWRAVCVFEANVVEDLAVFERECYFFGDHFCVVMLRIYDRKQILSSPRGLNHAVPALE